MRMNSRKIIFLESTAIILLCFLFFAYFARTGGIREVKNKIYAEKLENYIYSPKPVSDKVLKDEDDAFYTKFHFIAHSGGGTNVWLYSNSFEAWNESYSKGIRIIDADLSWTSDGELVLCHGWNENLEQRDGEIINRCKSVRNTYNLLENYTTERSPLSYNDFMSSKIYKKLTPMDLNSMFVFMDDHTDLYVAVDLKEKFTDGYAKIVGWAKEHNKENLLERIIVSFYSYEDKELIEKVYPFKNWIIRQYVNLPHNIYELADYCVNNNVHVVNCAESYCTEEFCDLMKSHGIHVYIAVADYISEMAQFYNIGADGAVSNCLTESDWKLIE